VLKWRTLVVVCGLAALMAMPAWAAETAAKEKMQETVGSATGEACPRSLLDQIKNPVDWFKWGADLRLREEFHNNNFDFYDDKKSERFVDGAGVEHRPGNDLFNYFRGRARVWAEFGPFLPTEGMKEANGLSFYARLTTEPRYYMENTTSIGNNWIAYNHGEYGTTNKQVIYDNLYFDWKRIGGAPISLKVGRQDLIYGRGFVILDGTPLDGSRTIYSDAIKATLHLDSWNTAIDFLAIDNDGGNTRLSSIGPRNSVDRPYESEFDTKVYGVYGMTKVTKDMEVNAYYLFKDDDPTGTYKALGYTGRQVHTIGGLIQGTFAANWDYYAEAAGQWGKERSPMTGKNNNRTGYAVATDLGYTFKDVAWTPRAHGVYEVYSGDKNGTSTYEGWDPVLARWPHFSELWANHAAVETGTPGAFTNMHRLGAGFSLKPPAGPFEAVDLLFDYSYLWANTHTNGRTGFYNSGYDIGQMITGVLRIQFMKCLEGHIWGEYLFPGRYYNSSFRDTAWFWRWQLTYTF